MISEHHEKILRLQKKHPIFNVFVFSINFFALLMNRTILLCDHIYHLNNFSSICPILLSLGFQRAERNGILFISIYSATAWTAATPWKKKLSKKALLTVRVGPTLLTLKRVGILGPLATIFPILILGLNLARFFLCFWIYINNTRRIPFTRWQNS